MGQLCVWPITASIISTCYMRWVETREKRSPADTAVDLYIKGILDRKHLKTTSDDLRMIAVLALSTNLDLVHAFITSTKFFEALDALACPQSE